jgi:hypothetical protein
MTRNRPQARRFDHAPRDGAGRELGAAHRQHRGFVRRRGPTAGRRDGGRPARWRAAGGSGLRSTAAPTCRHGPRPRSAARRHARPAAGLPAARAGP